MNQKNYPTPSRPTSKYNNLNNEQIFLTASETADYLKKSVGAVRNLVYRKQLPAFKPGGRLLFKKNDIDRWVERSRLKVGYGN